MSQIYSPTYPDPQPQPGSFRDRATKAQNVRDLLDSLTPHERDSYRIVNVLRSLAGENVGGLEREISDGIARKLGRSPQNAMYVPTSFRAVRSGLDTLAGNQGGFTVPTQVGSLIELLRNKSVLIRMGAQVLSGLTDTVAFPYQLSGATGYWMAENPGVDVVQSDASFGQRTGSPHTYEATTSYSRKLLVQSSIDIEAFVRSDLAKAHALAVDAAGINGPGTGNAPLGLLKTSGIGSVAVGSDGGRILWSHVVGLETSVAQSNADQGALKYLTTPSIRSRMKQTQKDTNVLQWLWEGNLPGDDSGMGSVNGYPGWVSNQVPSTLTKGSNSDCAALIFGDFSQIYICEWGTFLLQIDPYALKKQAMIECTSTQMTDVVVRQPAAFAAVLDARNV
jgi:HK97 family phage major capsid protein